MTAGLIIGFVIVAMNAVAYRWGYSDGRERERSDQFWRERDFPTAPEFHNNTLMACDICDDCNEYTLPGSLEDILGVWRDQGPFPLRNTADVALFVDEIHRLRALVLVTAARATADVAEHADAFEGCLRDMVIATGPLAAGDAKSDVLVKLLDVRNRACELLELDPAGHDWTTES